MSSARQPRIDVYPGRELLAELRSHAEAGGMSVSAAACQALAVGLAELRRAHGRERDDIASLAARLDDAEAMLHLMGPPLLGLPGLIAYWAVRCGELPVQEDELLEEFSRHAESLWESEMDAAAEAVARRARGDATCT